MRVLVVGDATLDVTVSQRVPTRPAGDAPASIRVGPGGAGANVAVRLARRGLSVRLAAPIADDPVGRLISRSLAADGVTVDRLPADRSSVVVVMLDAVGERTMHSDRVTIEAAAAAAALSGAEWVHCSGYALLDEVTGDALAAAVSRLPDGVRTSVSGGSLPPDPRLAERLRERLAAARVDLLVLSLDEASALLGRASDAAEAATMLRTLAAVVAVTEGAAGAALAAAGVELQLPARAGDPVDRTGAGDAFAAALIAELVGSSWPPDAPILRSALEAAVLAGAQVVGVRGAQGRVPSEPAAAS